MRGVGGPLLCIGDLLSDLGESDSNPSQPDLHTRSSSSASASSVSGPIDASQNLDLTKIYQENYKNLNEALAGSDHSWTAQTLKLCSALETANKLVQSTNSNVRSLTEKVGELEQVIKRGDSAVAAARGVHATLIQKNETPACR